MFRKSAVLSVGGYMDCPLFEDYYLWARLINANHRIANLVAVLVETEIDDDFFSRRGGLKYIRAEGEFLVRLYKLNFVRVYDIVVWVVLRTPLRLLPRAFRKMIYVRCLRS